MYSICDAVACHVIIFCENAQFNAIPMEDNLHTTFSHTTLDKSPREHTERLVDTRAYGLAHALQCYTYMDDANPLNASCNFDLAR